MYHVGLIFFFCKMSAPCVQSFVFSSPWLECDPHCLRPESRNSPRTDTPSTPPSWASPPAGTLPLPEIISALLLPQDESHVLGSQPWNLDLPLHHNHKPLLPPHKSSLTFPKCTILSPSFLPCSYHLACLEFPTSIQSPSNPISLTSHCSGQTPRTAVLKNFLVSGHLYILKIVKDPKQFLFCGFYLSIYHNRN